MRNLLRWLAVIGLVVQLAGSAVLIEYGVGSYIPTDDAGFSSDGDPADLKVANAADRGDRRHEKFNKLGFALIFAGTLAQIADAVRRARLRTV